MSLRLEMLQVARLAPGELGEAAVPAADYLKSQFNPDGGVRDRDGRSDLYYTVFGLEGLIALRAAPPAAAATRFLEGFGDGDGLDLVHLSCLARCWASLAPAAGIPRRAEMLERLEGFRAGDGGYGPVPGARHATVYHSFLAAGARQDLGDRLPEGDGLVRCLEGLRAGDGAYANERGLPMGSTPATAAAVTLLRNLGAPVSAAVGRWLLDRAAAGGGFLAMPEAPIPDLLSTATALHALAGLEISCAPIRDDCLDFVDTLWTGRGFCGSWTDDCADVEYTYYGLLALGHLSL